AGGLWGAAARVLGRAAHHLGRRARAPRSEREATPAPSGRRSGGGDDHPPGLPRRAVVIRALAVAGVLVAAAVAVFALALRQPGPTRRTPVIVTVDEGERFGDVADELRRLGLLRHPLPLAAWARPTRPDRAGHR